MATYIVLAKFTEQGLKAIKESQARRSAARELAKSLGGEIKQTYLTTGRYDLVVVGEFPDEEAVAQMALRIGMQGNLRTETMLAFDESAVDRIVGAL